MRKIFPTRRHYVTACAGVRAVASAFIHPFGLKTNSAGPLLSGADVDPAVVRILEKSCQNCYSERTEWPWYSYVAPMSWLIEKDVHEARSHLNLSVGASMTPRSNMTSWLSSPLSCETAECRSPAILSCIPEPNELPTNSSGFTNGHVSKGGV